MKRLKIGDTVITKEPINGPYGTFPTGTEATVILVYPHDDGQNEATNSVEASFKLENYSVNVTVYESVLSKINCFEG